MLQIVNVWVSLSWVCIIRIDTATLLFIYDFVKRQRKVFQKSASLTFPLILILALECTGNCCTTDWSFRCFTKVRKSYLTYPVPTRGKDENQTAARWEISEFPAMIKWRHHVLLHLSIFKKIIYHFCEDGIEKSVPYNHR